ncbi:MAG: hypothetical protein KI790_13125 [Cyclobacteriaceae bacterium]|nr:hypothetical protein [Cyclobacteriaceae bacterium HetDA_MAG_MS6]
MIKSLFLPLFLICYLIQGQDFKRIEFTESDGKTGYYLVDPSISNPDGTIFLIAGFGGNPEEIFQESQIPSVAKGKNILTIGLSNELQFYMDEDMYRHLKESISNALIRYQIKSKNFVIGGFSAGGVIAARFCERTVEDSLNDFTPQGLFTVDAALDLSELYRYFIREISRVCSVKGSEIGKNEAKFISEMMIKEFGGTLDDKAIVYQANSPLNIELADGGNAKYLAGIPVRAYHEPDVQWQIMNRCRDMRDNNVNSGSILINTLRQLGNNQAELMLTLDKGYRNDGRRHPHSWSIVNEEELIKWVETLLK